MFLLGLRPALGRVRGVRADAVAAVADELGTTSAAVSLAWLRAREGTVVPVGGARRVEHLRDNLAGLEVPLTAAHLPALDEISAPVLGYPAPMHGALRAMLARCSAGCACPVTWTG